MNNTTLYTYADGSANVYVISPTSLEYIPVRPEESSTGMYSGGEPKTVSLTSGQFDSIRSLLDKALNDSSIHIKDRIKTSGAISVDDGKELKQCIIKPGASEIMAIETLLKEVLGHR